jgi:hypothetical protein
MKHVKTRIIRPILLAGIVGTLLLVAWQPLLVLALPSRPSPKPAVTSAPKLPDGVIELTVESAPAGLWTVVQWQDALGDWHNVEGWQGTLDEGNKKAWWVDKADLGKGPFRWAVTQSGERLATSESFYLPDSVGQTVRVSISLVP